VKTNYLTDIPGSRKDAEKVTKFLNNLKLPVLSGSSGSKGTGMTQTETTPKQVPKKTQKHLLGTIKMVVNEEPSKSSSSHVPK
ncbi:hypothetical protein ElyMa_004716200, partial [Elysia marginata]